MNARKETVHCPRAAPPEMHTPDHECSSPALSDLVPWPTSSTRARHLGSASATLRDNHERPHGSGQDGSAAQVVPEELGGLGRALRPGMILRPDNGHQRMFGWMAWGCLALPTWCRSPKLLAQVFLKQPCLCPPLLSTDGLGSDRCTTFLGPPPPLQWVLGLYQ